MSIYFSKLKIISGLQCPPALYLEVHQPELAAESVDLRKILASGNQVPKSPGSCIPAGS
jgi:hypothetical protein